MISGLHLPAFLRTQFPAQSGPGNVDPKKLSLEEAEGDIHQNLISKMKSGEGEKESDYGLKIEDVGIKRILLGQSVTQTVFERMRRTRERLAEGALTQGVAEATRILSGAENDRKRILAFADRRAKAIEAKGFAEAAQHYRAFRQNEEFAVFLRKLDGLEDILKHRTTFLLGTDGPPFDLFEEQEDGDEPSRTRNKAE